MSSLSAAWHTTVASTASEQPLRASTIPARRSRPSSTAPSVPACSRASWACRPCRPRQTWAATPPLVTGTRPASRSRFTGAATSRSPRSAASNAPASSTSITPNPRPPPAPGAAMGCHRGPRPPGPGPEGSITHLLCDLAMLSLISGQKVIDRPQPPVMIRFGYTPATNVGTGLTIRPGGHRVVTYLAFGMCVYPLSGRTLGPLRAHQLRHDPAFRDSRMALVTGSSWALGRGIALTCDPAGSSRSALPGGVWLPATGRSAWRRRLPGPRRAEVGQRSYALGCVSSGAGKCADGAVIGHPDYGLAI
jgi:hypothetical protein